MTRLRSARQESGLTQKQLAKMADMSEGHLSLIEQGYIPLRSHKLDALAKALNRSVAELFPEKVPA